jgi:hypothetical protein
LTTIYCDESGFSGPNLYRDSAPYFVYAGIAIEEGVAAGTIERIKKFFKRFQGEIKFGKLVQTAEGQAALDWLLNEQGHRVKIWYANKKYATAGKFFEYVFEPVLCDNSILFYQHNFHRFIANALFAGMEALDRQADELLADLQKMIHLRDASGLNRLLSPQPGLLHGPVTVFDEIATFALGYRDRILDEVNSLAELGDSMVWMMDLSLTALCMVVRSYAKDTPNLIIVCDESKPLKASREVAEAIIQADFSSLRGRSGWKTGAHATLTEPVKFIRLSKNTPGIQLADIFAGMARVILTAPDEQLSKGWEDRIWPLIIAESVEADLDYIDLDRPAVYANAMVLKQLAERARKGVDPLRGMHSFYESALRYATDKLQP